MTSTSYLCVSLPRHLKTRTDILGIQWQNGLGLAGIVIAVLVPVAMRKAWASDLKDAARPDVAVDGEVRLDDLEAREEERFELGSDEDEDEERRIGRE